jgi:hypothetical protein
MNPKMPYGLEQKIKSNIFLKINPPGHRVFFKLSLAQLMASFLVLAICPQFHLGFFSHSFLTHILMSWGEVYCNIVCGAIFLGTGTIFSFLFLSSDELRVLKRNQFIYFPTLILLSLLSFVILGVKIQLLMFLIWGLGAKASAIGILSAYYFVKISMLNQTKH